MYTALVIYVGTVLLPLHGLLWLGMRRETVAQRRILHGLWRMSKGSGTHYSRNKGR